MHSVTFTVRVINTFLARFQYLMANVRVNCVLDCTERVLVSFSSSSQSIIFPLPHSQLFFSPTRLTSLIVVASEYTWPISDNGNLHSTWNCTMCILIIINHILCLHSFSINTFMNAWDGKNVYWFVGGLWSECACIENKINLKHFRF